jgi:alkylation response protein AidB-like acyl-CoA dehydrogenase
MEIQFSAEQDDLRRSLRRFLEQRSPSSEVRRLMATDEGFDPAVWKQLAAEMGLVGLAIPEAAGGSGYGIVELAVVFEELGRSLLCAPYLSTTLASQALVLSGFGADLLPSIAEGATRATLALCGESGSWALDDLPVTASSDGVLDGVATYVLDGTTADLVLVVAAGPDGPGLYAVTGPFETSALETLDLTRKLATLTFAATASRYLGPASSWWPSLLDVARVCLACEQVGAAQWCLDTSVEYAKLRYQFNRPIGSFQAVKHRLADMLLDVENARSAAYYATFTLAEASDEAATVVPLTSAVCAENLRRVAADCIQVHGGIGFTWEHDAHLYYRRAGSSALQFGDAAEQWTVLANAILD